MLKPKLNFTENFKGLDYLQALFLCAFWAFFLWASVVLQLYAQDLTIPYDAKAQFYNFFRFMQNALQAGEFPLWNPYHYSGFPSVADPQSFVFSLPFLVFATLKSDVSPQAFDSFVIAHLAFGAFFTSLLALKLRFTLIASLIAATIFFFGGSAMGRLQHIGLIASYSFLPVCLLFLWLTLEKKSYSYGLIFTGLAVIMALGRDQVAMLNCLMLIAFMISKSLEAGKPFDFFIERWKLLSFMAVLGVALLFIPMLLTLQFAKLSNRPEIQLNDALTGSFDIFNLLNLIFANFYGSLTSFDAYWGAGAAKWWFKTATDISVNYFYIGALSSLLLLYALLSKAVFQKHIRFYTFTSFVLFIYAIGKATPLYSFLFENISIFKLYRRPADATFPLIFCFSLMAASGFDALKTFKLPSQKALKITGISVSFLLIGALAQIGEMSKLIIPLKSILIAALILAVGFALYKVKPALLLIVIAADLCFHSSIMPFNFDKKLNYGVFYQESKADNAVLTILNEQLQLDHNKGLRPRVEILGLENGWQNAAMSYGIENTIGYNPLRLHRYEQATGASENAHEPIMRPFPKSFRGYRSRLARLLGIEYLVFDTPLEQMPRSLLRSRLTLLKEGAPYWVYKLPQAAPRVMLAFSAKEADFNEVMKTGEIPDFEMAKEALIDKGIKLALVSQQTALNAQGQAEIVTYKRNTVKIITESDQSSLLVLHDIHYPGWEVFVNGESRQLIRANVLFRGVELASGRHEVTFVFKPFSTTNIKNALMQSLSR